MGGEGAMRAAAKVAGIGVVTGGFRGFQPQNPVTAAARKATRPVSAIATSSDGLASDVLFASQNINIDASVQRPCWELDDWEFAGDEEELILNSGEPMPRLVFGGVPTLQETKEATSELKDVLEKVYLCSPKSTESRGSHIADQESVSKACLTSETTGTPSVSKHAIQAFRFLNESPAAQSVVASIACDKNVWNAVLENKALVEFLESHKISVDSSVQKSVAFSDRHDQQPKCLDEPTNSVDPNSGNGFVDFLQNIKLTVVSMMSSLSDYFQNLFEGPVAEKASTDEDGIAKNNFVGRALEASFMALAIMVIMVVVLKRG